MQELKDKLYESIEKYGINDLRTLALSQQLDEEIVRLQKQYVEDWAEEKKEILKTVVTYKTKADTDIKYIKIESFWKGAAFGWGIFMLMYVIYKVLGIVGGM